MSEDIVTRLRAVLHNDRSVELMNREAADEIDRKNLTIRALTEERDEVVRMANKLTAERDEARRSVCEMSLQLGRVFRRIGGKKVEVTTPEGCAEIMRWDCFKEKP